MTSAFKPYIANARIFGPYSFDFLIADEIGKAWYDGSQNQYMPERQWCLDHVRPGFTILDCGAHHGMMTVLFSLMTGPTGRVLAWEALPDNAEVIRQNVALNNCTNVNVHPKALGARRRTARYVRNHGNLNIFPPGSDRPDSESIEIIALDEDIKPSLRVDFLKLDVEGSELEALQGAAGVLAQRPIIDLELHNFLFSDRTAILSAIFEILRIRNYTYEVLPEPFESITKIGPKMDIAWLEQFHNPHVFCIPL